MRLRVTTRGQEAFVWESRAAQFRVGRSPECQLRFEGNAAEFVSWTHALFTQDRNGLARVRDLGSSNGTWVDGTCIEGLTELQVGSVIQLGRAGAKLEVLELQAGEIASPAPEQRPQNSVPTLAAKSSQPQDFLALNKNWVGLALGGAAIVGLLVVYQSSSRREQLSAEGPTTSPAPKPNVEEPPKDPTPSPEPKRPPESLPNIDKPDAAQPAAPDNGPTKAVQPGVQLVLVEDPEGAGVWLVTCAAVVGPRHLLTTATIANELAEFLKKGWPVRITGDPQREGVPLREIHVHAAYPKAEPKDQLFFDLAVLTVAERLPAAQPLELAPDNLSLERGLNLTLMGGDRTEPNFPLHQIQELSLDDLRDLALKTFPLRLFSVESIAPEPGAPQVLVVLGPALNKVVGDPLLDGRGRLVALYCEPAPAGPPGTNAHYAKRIDAGLVRAALNGKINEDLWASVSIAHIEQK